MSLGRQKITEIEESQAGRKRISKSSHRSRKNISSEEIFTYNSSFAHQNKTESQNL